MTSLLFEAEPAARPDPLGGQSRFGAASGRIRAAGSRPDVRLIAGAAVVVLAAFNLFWRLGSADLHFDEPLYAEGGWQAIHRVEPVPDHPLLGKYLIGFSQVLFGQNAVGARLLPVACSFVATYFVFALLRRMAGCWTGLFGAALWAGLPRAFVVAGETIGQVRGDRYALLDTIENAAAIVVLYQGWRWSEEPTVRRSLALGVALGVAVSSKFTGLTLIAPLVVVGLLMVRPLSWLARCLAGIIAAAAAVVALTYVPFGTQGPSMFRKIFALQELHLETGHFVPLGRSVWLRAPWWANAYLWWHSQGPALVLALVIGMAAVCWHRQRVGAVYLLSATVAIMGALSSSAVALSHYWVAWFGPLVLVAALGTSELFRRGRAATILGVVVLAVFAVSILGATRNVATMPKGDFSRMARTVLAHGPPPQRAVRLSGSLQPYFPGITETYAVFATEESAPDIVVLQRHLAISTPDGVVLARRIARAEGLHRHRQGDLEYWTRYR